MLFPNGSFFSFRGLFSFLCCFSFSISKSFRSFHFELVIFIYSFLELISVLLGSFVDDTFEIHSVKFVEEFQLFSESLQGGGVIFLGIPVVLEGSVNGCFDFVEGFVAFVESPVHLHQLSGVVVDQFFLLFSHFFEGFVFSFEALLEVAVGDARLHLVVLSVADCGFHLILHLVKDGK